MDRVQILKSDLVCICFPSGLVLLIFSDPIALSINVMITSKSFWVIMKIK